VQKAKENFPAHNVVLPRAAGAFVLYLLCLLYLLNLMRSWLPLAAIAVLCALGIAVFSAWRADQRERHRLQSELAAAQKTVAQLTAQQDQRHAQLNKTLRTLSAQKKSVQTPEQALRALPDVLPLPSALREAPLLTASASPLGAPTANITRQPNPAGVPPRNSATVSPKPILLPAEDLQPLYNFAVDCRACQAKLAAAQADLADERAKTQALGRERDAALRAARGGSFWNRIGRAAKWFAIGAAAGALAARTGR